MRLSNIIQRRFNVLVTKYSSDTLSYNDIPYILMFVSDLVTYLYELENERNIIISNYRKLLWMSIDINQDRIVICEDGGNDLIVQLKLHEGDDINDLFVQLINYINVQILNENNLAVFKLEKAILYENSN